MYTAGTTDYLHFAADAVFKWRGFGWINEVVTRDAGQDRITGTAEDGSPLVEYSRSGWGFVSQPSLMLTDHVELEARYGRLAARPGTDPAYIDDVAARANEVALGTSVYLNGHRFKIQAGVTTLFGDDTGPTRGELASHLLVDAMF